MSARTPRREGKRELAFSVTRKDLKIDTFSAGGPGGQHQRQGKIC
jgi:protein subunit release factor B